MATQILLNPIGSGGDVFPFLAIGRELQRRGHHVAVMTNRMFCQNVGQAGMEFIEIGSKDALRQVGSDPGLHRSGNAWKLALKWGAVGTMRQTFEIIQVRIKRCDTMVIAPCLGFGARLAAEKLGVPLATVVLSPFVIRSVFQSPLIRPLMLGDWVPKVLKRIQYWIADRVVIDPLIITEVEAFRKEIGLAPGSRYLHRWCFSPDLNLAFFPEAFASPQPDWPPNTHLTGPVSWDPPSDPQLVAALDQFLKPGPKPIVVLAGSAGPESSGFYEKWIQAAKGLNRQLILLEQNQNKVPKELPNHVFHATYFSIDELLGRSALVAHGGGVGTTLRSLAAGTPQILFPKVNDQPDNADRVRRMGVGKVIRADRLDVDRLISLVTEVVKDEAMLVNCEKTKNAMTTEEPVKHSCDLIESTFAAYRS